MLILKPVSTKKISRERLNFQLLITKKGITLLFFWQRQKSRKKQIGGHATVI